LKNFLERFLVFGNQSTPAFIDLLNRFESLSAPTPIVSANLSSSGGELMLKFGPLNDMEKEIIKILYERTGGNKKEIERRLNLSTSTLRRRLMEIYPKSHTCPK
jgi:DNA-binding NtrC family response regulator